MPWVLTVCSSTYRIESGAVEKACPPSSRGQALGEAGGRRGAIECKIKNEK